jgi:hypothetical protein
MLLAEMEARRLFPRLKRPICFVAVYIRLESQQCRHRIVAFMGMHGVVEGYWTGVKSRKSM